ncbi:7709_t:CDS:2 [Diversispora eburnea]|uniref:7709_t:CDS:1 n=1 Tax=Diversispora eburnea TaxID=1213867 RepID=A0A9N9A8U8_9GLOM|nr:7709_t:CDS:2 [Diversispora eburnea]
MLFSITLTALVSAVVISTSVILLISKKCFETEEQENRQTNENSDQYLEETNEANNQQNDSHSQNQIIRQNKKFVSSPFIIKEKQQKRNSVIAKQHTKLESITEETDDEINNEGTNDESLLTHDGNAARRSINSMLVSRRKQQKLIKISKRYSSMESIMEETDEE